MSVNRLEPAEIQNTKTSAAFLKRNESIENGKLLLNLSDKFFSELKGYLVKLFSKRLLVSLVFAFVFRGIY